MKKKKKKEKPTVGYIIEIILQAVAAIAALISALKR